MNLFLPTQACFIQTSTYLSIQDRLSMTRHNNICTRISRTQEMACSELQKEVSDDGIEIVYGGEQCSDYS